MKERAEKKVQQKRKRAFIRYRPDPGVYALIDVNPDRSTFKPTIPALVITESHTGAGLLIVENKEITRGGIIRVQVGKLPPLKAEVRWKEKLDSEASKIGLHFLE